MYSYRDPNPQNTLNVYARTMRWAAEQDWTERDLEEAKLSIFQKMDRPISVSQEGMSRFLQGIDYDMGQRRREWLLDTTKSQIKDAAEGLIKKVDEEAYITVLGNKAGQEFLDADWQVEDMGKAGEAVEMPAEAASVTS
jgi:Zn-dependent M16 (insulinase) family peptidase